MIILVPVAILAIVGVALLGTTSERRRKRRDAQEPHNEWPSREELAELREERESRFTDRKIHGLDEPARYTPMSDGL